ncbi:MAG: hypothetical protein LBD85_00130 [Oscillospiraceae bacterium]|jgi:hypothetical protein|nr:hypothetical protein [Oscillospiraceae bacterium]
MTIRDVAIAFGYEVDSASEKGVNDSVDKLKSYAHKALGALTVAFSIKGLSKLAEAAADADALKSQFSQVFGDIEDDASKKLQSLADKTGVAAGRMQGSFTQMAAFAKTSGMDTASALGLSERAIEAVADSAAFYDKSLEEVTASLQSFLKGNFANDAALGLSATETTRNAAANALFGKSYKDLAEDQKQLTLLKMVEDANRLSGAYGQAARESDTWTNQLGNLKRSLTELAAAAGNIILKPAVQLLKLLTTVISTVTAAIKELTREGRFLNRMGEHISNWLKQAQARFEMFVKMVGGAENALKLFALAASAVIAAMNYKQIIAGLKGIGSAIGKINLKMVAIVAVILMVALAIDDLINFVSGNNSVIGGLFEKLGIDGEAVKSTIKGIMDAVKGLLPMMLSLAKSVGGSLFEAAKGILPMLIEFGKQILPMITGFIKQLVPMVAEFAKNIGGELFGAAKKILPLLISLGKTLMEAAKKILPVIIKLISAVIPILMKIIESVLPVIISLIEAVIPILMKIIEAVLPVIISLIEKLLPVILQIAEAVLPIILSLIEAILPLITTIIETILPVILTLIEAILPIITPIVELIGELASAILPVVVSLIEALSPLLKTALSVLKPILEVIGGIVDFIGKIVGWVGKGFKWVVNLITGGGDTPTIEVDDGGDPVQPASKTKGYAAGTNYTPDTFIAGEEGPELITGAKGRKVFTARQTEGILGALAAFSNGVAATSATAQAVTQSMTNKVIEQTNYFQNTFNGDKAGQKKSAEAMGKAAKDTTAELARGLAYAR